MNYLHYEIEAEGSDTIEVLLSGAANVQLLDDANFALYREGKQFHYFGGLARTSPFTLKAPRSGHWHIVIDLGGSPGQVRAAIKVLQAA